MSLSSQICSISIESKKINVRVIFSNNESGTSSPTVVLPVVHQCNDYNSLGQLLLADYQQYPDLKTHQLGKDYNISWAFVPHVRGDVLGVGRCPYHPVLTICLAPGSIAHQLTSKCWEAAYI